MPPEPEPIQTGTTESEAPPKDNPRGLKHHGRAIVASLILVVGFGWLMNKGGLPWLPPEGALRDVDASYLSLFVAAMAVHLVSRYWRYRFLIAPVMQLPDRRVISINAIALALITLLPLRLGEFAKPAMLRERGRLSFGAVTGTVAAERILDGVVFSVAILLSLFIAPPREPLPTHIGTLPVPASVIPNIARFASLGFGVAFAVMAMFYFFRDFARRITAKVLGAVSEKLAERVAGMVERLSDGLRFLTNPRDALPYLVVTVFGLIAQAWSLQMLGNAVGITGLTLPQTTLATGVLALGFALPNAPGFFGAVQLSLYAGLAAYVEPEKVVHEGAAFVFIFYVTYVGLVMVFAALSVLVEYGLPKSAQHQSEMP